MESALITVEARRRSKCTMKRKALRRCATNLIDNALEIRQDRSEGDDPARRTLRARRRRRRRPGIAMRAARGKRFALSTGLDEGRNLQTGGSGLGLAIARDIARVTAGTRSESSPLGGLRATIRLPVETFALPLREGRNFRVRERQRTPRKFGEGSSTGA